METPPSVPCCQPDDGSARRGGGGGGDGEDDDCDGGDYVPPDLETPPRCDMGACACAMVPEPTCQYELPGLYYNGTFNVTHHLSDNSAWLFENPHWSPEKQCLNNDHAVKTYEYPGLFFVGATGNDSDTNPIFWIL
ncbi:hypothetical protein NW754_015387 [Fusarium falciforme]|uniref:Uncharacterized protein n=1 Tax=Fusarium falciforme TaxID=195108 RepID=A0A9W8R0B6_9HYPO|nr:hypothetical protein NW754_015387 [Fusarium falciforme]KAJ4182753.1 hypothetical protein NW755_010250 [Fusarium falciforme]